MIQDSAAEVEALVPTPDVAALVETVRGALSYYSAGQAQGPATSRRLIRALAALDSLTQQLEKLREERDEARRGLRGATLESDERAAKWMTEQERAEAAEAERDVALELVKVLEEALREIITESDLAHYMVAAAIARRALGSSHA